MDPACDDRWFERLLAIDGASNARVVVLDLERMRPGAMARAAARIALPPRVARSVAKRRAEYAAGRLAASAVLGRLGCPRPRSVAAASDGAPIWPAGFVGSITHAGGLVAAAAAPAAHYAGIGIDIEAIVRCSDAAELRSVVVNDAELETLRTALPQNDLATLVTLAFSAKESLYKCLYPLVGEFFEFADAQIVAARVASNGMGGVQFALARALGALSPGWLAQGRFAIASPRVHTAVVVARNVVPRWVYKRPSLAL